MYKDRGCTGKEITALRFCFVLSCGRNLNTQSERSDMQAITSKGASLCQLITEPGGYSITSHSETYFGEIEI